MKVLLVDDHPLVLTALQTVIRSIGSDTTVVGVDNAEAAREALRTREDFDLVMLDLSLGEVDGFEVLDEFRAAYPAVPVVVVSASERISDVIRAIDSGAMGFVPKTSSHAELHRALELVMTGSMYVPPHLLGLAFGPRDEAVRAALEAERAADRAAGLERGTGADGAPPRAAPHQQVKTMQDIGLTPRQTEVLSLLLQGLPNKLIARQLNLSVETVKDHVAAVLRALGVSTRTQAVLAVSQMTQGQGAGFSWRPPAGGGGAR